jgi:hypothetical protein
MNAVLNWPNRDPLWEMGFERIRQPSTPSSDHTANLYAFVGNNPINTTDAYGLKIWVCNRPVSGFPFVGNHGYLWDDTTKSGCGKRGSSGIGPTTGPVDTGPGGAGQDCYPVTGSDGKEAAVMACCRKSANRWPWIPFFSDCHNKVDDCLGSNGLDSPPHPRFGKPAPLPVLGPDPAPLPWL